MYYRDTVKEQHRESKFLSSATSIRY